MSGSVTQAALEDALTLPPEQSPGFGSFLSVADPAATLADSDAPMWMSLMPRVFRCVCPLGWYMCERARDVMCSVPDFLMEAVTAAVREMEGGISKKRLGGLSQIETLREVVDTFLTVVATLQSSVTS